MRFVNIHFSCTGFNYKSGTRSIISGSLSYIVLGSFVLDYSTRTVSFTYILLSICATVFAACPVDTSEMVVSGVSGAGAGDVAVVIWFGTFTFKVFSFDWLVFYCGIRFLWVKGVIQVGMFDRIILSIRQQVEKGSKIIWDIFEIPLMIYTVLTKWFIHLAIFGGHVWWRQLWKSW